MADQYDAVNPANLPASVAGRPATRITVLGDESADAFDFEQGNVGIAAIAPSIRARWLEGLWSIGYVNEGNADELRQAVDDLGVPWLAASSWPARGAYIWAATGGATPGTIPAWCWVAPLLVQDRYLGTVDISTVFGAYPARAAGYIDGAHSKWPAAAWAPYPRVAPPAPPHKEEDMWVLAFDGNGQTDWLMMGATKRAIPDQGELNEHMGQGVPVRHYSLPVYQRLAAQATTVTA